MLTFRKYLSVVIREIQIGSNYYIPPGKTPLRSNSEAFRTGCATITAGHTNIAAKTINTVHSIHLGNMESKNITQAYKR